MKRWEINFAPARRFVAGHHQPDVAYRLNAPTLDEAKQQAVIWLRAENPGTYRFQNAREIAP